MKIFCILVLAFVAGSCIAAEPTWNPADAVKEAEQDIRTGYIKFYWAGSVASRPIGVPIEVAKKYPKPMLESAASPTIYPFENDRKNMPGVTTKRCLPTFLKSTSSHLLMSF